MRFLADENVSRLVVERLRGAGFDVTSIGATHSGASDNEVLATAIDEGLTPSGDPQRVIRQRPPSIRARRAPRPALSDQHGASPSR